MKRGSLRAVCAVFVLLAAILSGCQWRQLVVQIPDFEANLIEGVQLWRAEDAESPSFAAIERIVFLGSQIQSGTELIEYQQLDEQNQPKEETSWAMLVRGGDEAGSATLHFTFAPWTHPEGWIRVSTFNPVGESQLSAEAVLL